ncbi:hypothetical protein NCS52_00533600 [Fusarium sp. LHS14.1]|nr:hypothetical protein NCS52_00533600 [Fusarium sp. LHS14.1]
MSAIPPLERADAVPNWIIGLVSETFLKCRGVNPFHASPPQAQTPDSTARVLPQFDEKSHTFIPAEQDCIIVALDFRDLCRWKIALNHLGQQNHSYKPITEAGWAYIDAKNILRKGIAPGDRGQKLQTLMEQHHWLVEEFRGHWGETCHDREHKPAPYSFAFGKSELVPESKLGHRLNNVFMYLCKLNRTAEEKEHNKLRKVVFLTWDSRLVEMTIERLGLNWFSQPNVEIWDMQKRFVCPGPRLEFALHHLGIRFVDQFFGNLARNSGNVSMFLLQMFLSTFYMADGMRNAFVRGQNLPCLPYSWAGVDLGQVNVPPGQLPTHRPPECKNDNNVPQKSDPKIWP